MGSGFQDALEPLAGADPGLAAEVLARLACKQVPVHREALDQLVEEALWALGVEPSFGRAVALGCADLVGEVPSDRLETFRNHLRRAGDTGPTLGRILAECLPPVLAFGDAGTLSRFQLAWAAMARKGTHTLLEPLRALGPLLAGGGRETADVYLELLRTLFGGDLSYDEGRYFASELPKAVQGLGRQRRQWQVVEILRVARTDRRLVEPFLAGLSRGLGLLQEDALRRFVGDALLSRRRQREHVARALSLESLAARERFSTLQVSVGFAQERERLRRYLQARTGLALSIRPLSALPGVEGAALGSERLVCSGAQTIYLPDEISRFPRRQENAELYKLLIRLEASLHEFGSFDFDGEKTPTPCPGATGGDRPLPGRSDLEGFLAHFPDMGLAGDLFTVFELGRIRKCVRQTYPGLLRRAYPSLRRAFVESGERGPGPPDVIHRLLARLAFALPDPGADALSDEIAQAFDATVTAASPVDAAADMTARFFEPVRSRAVWPPGGRPPLRTPFGWRPWPNPAAAGEPPLERLARRIQAVLAQGGLEASPAKIKQRLKAGGGTLTTADIRNLCREQGAAAGRLETLFGLCSNDHGLPENRLPEDLPAFRYPEWDDRLGDYLPEHVQVRERRAPDVAGDFYADVLRRHSGLVRQTRRVFECLRPEGLKRLRRWPDGDEFDYRQLVEAAIDRRIGDLPSDRLFIKRVKERRDVAVLLLVDLSRSTANAVPGAETSVLEIEKEAIVVLCEALSVLGDALAVAGFSGTGRLGVDYFRVKGFDEGLTEAVKHRIGALSPQRNTRMGAAIRHAARDLVAVPAPVRLLVILSDGFPNDTEYKGGYAVADTRQALTELRTRQIRFHALTVNLPADPGLDRLYGKARHHVISDLRELPGRLLRVYSALTR